jgi:GrpB-like predicted nucleotidyltransferase (UPF0157 family)
MIYLSPYNSKWPADFEDEKAFLQKAIPLDVIEIEHIGSTAIPSIYAKPIIDIMIGVGKLSDINFDIISTLEKNGYNYIKNYEVNMPYRRYFQKNNSEMIRTHQIHLVEINSDFWKRHLLFRNYLRAHPQDAKRYEKLKLELVKIFTDTHPYSSAKSEFCNEIYLKAIAWENVKALY